MIKPLHDNVILKKEEVENKTSSGIILTTETKKIPSVAKVVAVGPECKATAKPPNEYIIFVVSPVFTPTIVSPGFTGALVSTLLPNFTRFN